MMVVDAVSELVKSIAIWFNPDRREKAILRSAISAADELLKIYKKEGRYASFTDKKIEEYKIHYQKQFDAWKDGQT